MINNGRIYYIYFYAEQSRYPDLLPLIEETLDSLIIGQAKEINKQQKQETKPSDNLISYENSTYRLRLDHPYNWTLDEKTDPKIINPTTIVRFYSPSFYSPSESISKKNNALFDILIDDKPGIAQSERNQTLNLEAYLNKIIQEYKESLKNFRVIHADTNSSISGKPAYRLVFKFNVSGSMLKIEERGIIAHHDKVFKVQFYADMSKFEDYYPVIKK